MQSVYIQKNTYKACKRNGPAVSRGRMFCKWLLKKTIFCWYFKLLPQTVKTLQFLKKQLYPLMFLGKQLSKFSQLMKLQKKKKNLISHVLGETYQFSKDSASTEYNIASRENVL